MIYALEVDNQWYFIYKQMLILKFSKNPESQYLETIFARLNVAIMKNSSLSEKDSRSRVEFWHSTTIFRSVEQYFSRGVEPRSNDLEAASDDRTLGGDLLESRTVS